jgi:predicted TIM-barrel fold metal-dependent hydrolase
LGSRSSASPLPSAYPVGLVAAATSSVDRSKKWLEAQIVEEKPMKRDYRIVDADTHVLEPPDLWHEYIEPRYRDAAPHVYTDAQGNDILAVRGMQVREGQGRAAFEKGIGHIGAFGAAWGQGRIDIPYRECRGGYDPTARIAHMDNEKVDVAALFPSLGLALGGLEPPEFAAACYRAYNRWLADFCRQYQDRLIGVAMIPLQSVELAIAELRFARRELGMGSVFVRPNPCAGRQLHHPDYDVFWREAQELDMAVAVHSGSAVDMPTIAMDRFGDWFMTRHIVAHAMEEMLAMVSVIFCGVCDKFPKLRFGFFEGGGGWVAGWLDRMDRHNEKIFMDKKLSAPPTEIFRRQCWIAFDPGERALPHIVDYIGADNVLWASDYPHPDGVPFGAQRIADNPKVSEPNKRKILSDSALTFYGIK